MGGTMLFAMVMALVLPLQEAEPEASSQAERAPKHWTAVPWSKMPLPELPVSARGTLQAEVSCVAGEQNRVASCRIERQIPSEGRFGSRVLSSLRSARTRDVVRPGDTMTFTIWACMDVENGETCRRLPWPDEQ